jgi:hypothetical protein
MKTADSAIQTASVEADRSSSLLKDRALTVPSMTIFGPVDTGRRAEGMTGLDPDQAYTGVLASHSLRELS